MLRAIQVMAMKVGWLGLAGLAHAYHPGGRCTRAFLAVVAVIVAVLLMATCGIGAQA